MDAKVFLNIGLDHFIPFHFHPTFQLFQGRASDFIWYVWLDIKHLRQRLLGKISLLYCACH